MSVRNADDKVKVRVREARALSLAGETGSLLYRAGDELQLSADEAKQLQAQGFVKPA